MDNFHQINSNRFNYLNIAFGVVIDIMNIIKEK